MTRGRLVALALMLAGASGYAGYRLSGWHAEPAETPAARLAAPGLETAVFADLEGRPRQLAEWKDKLLVVNFWATWCPPCLTEIPGFVELQDRLGERGLQFVGVALDEPAAVAAFVAEHRVNYPVLVGQDEVARYMQALGNTIGALPFTAVLDADGRALHHEQGEWEAAEAEAVLGPMLDRLPRKD